MLSHCNGPHSRLVRTKSPAKSGRLTAAQEPNMPDALSIILIHPVWNALHLSQEISESKPEGWACRHCSTNPNST
ncbi:hypothetical protein FOZ61_003685 [Perkinsus olseni]|uniref:Uncharacterized protein n=1 Tax=Perkinsus olseni TaxID=32597 RepID=A0A7J6LNV8_PEROL|nr:hypothetical protein FOZ61_003685 [Perkinsus olseni]